MIRGSSVAESGETGARSGWFIALSGKLGTQSWFTRGSLGALGRNMHADDSGVSRGGVGGGVHYILSAIGYIVAESWNILV